MTSVYKYIALNNRTRQLKHMYYKARCVKYMHLSYHRCFIWLKSACRVYYRYLRQVIHDIVTSEVIIAKMQMVAIFSIDSNVWLKNVSNNSWRVVEFA